MGQVTTGDPDFYPRPPWGGRPQAPGLTLTQCPISIHALRGEGDKDGGQVMTLEELFLCTPSVGRATDAWEIYVMEAIFLSTPSVGRATFPA